MRGRDLSGALDLWSSLPPGTLTAKFVTGNADQAVFDVTLTEGAPLGLYGLRASTVSGLSNTHLFLVDELPIARRTDAATAGKEKAMELKLPACVTGDCRPAAVDRYRIAAAAGERLSFEIIGNRLGKDYDPLVTIRDAQGKLLAQEDNSPGLFFDCRFQHTFAAAGSYVVEVRDARFAGDAAWHYVLRIGDFPVSRVLAPAGLPTGVPTSVRLPQDGDATVTLHPPAEQPLGRYFQEVRRTPRGLATWVAALASDLPGVVETEPNDTAETGAAVTAPVALHGVLQTPGDEDWFLLELKKGDQIVVQSEARLLGSPADLELVLLEPKGNEVRRVDELIIREGRDSRTQEARFEFPARYDGPHALLVRDLISAGGPAFAYRVEVRASGPELTLKSDVARVTLPRGNWQPIPLTITRTRLAGPIALELHGAPPGVTLEPATIAADETEVACRIVASDSAPLGLSTLQIVGRWHPMEEPDETRPTQPGAPDATASARPIRISARAQTSPLIDKRNKNKDLILFALRDDQLDPPPSLAHAIALQVTPASTFHVELPRQTIDMTKYRTATLPIVTRREPELAADINFTASGGQIGDEAEERSNIFLRFPTATAERPKIDGEIYNRILTNYGAFRVDLEATAETGNRQVTLRRCFTLNVRSAFDPQPEETNIEIEPGGSTIIRLLAGRAVDFAGEVQMTALPAAGFTFKEEVVIRPDQEVVEFEIKADKELRLGRHTLRFVSRGQVGKYEEEVRGPVMTITVKAPPKPSS